MAKHGAKRVRNKRYTWYEINDQIGADEKPHEVLLESKVDPVAVATELERIYMGKASNLNESDDVRLRLTIERAHSRTTPEAS